MARSMTAAMIEAGRIEEVQRENLAIAKGLKRNDPELLDQLIETYQHRLLRYLLFLTGKREVAEDLFQETWMRVWRRLDADIRAAAFRGWLFVVGANLAKDLIRKKVSQPTSALGERDIVSAQADHVHELGFREKLEHCVKNLSPQHRDFLARLFNLETFDEIAAALGRNKTRIYQIKHEIGQQLLGCLGWVP